MARRRGPKEPAFGSDSFLDVIANLVGIVLIIIVLVGARIRHLPQLVMPLPSSDQAPPTVTLQPVEVDTTQEQAEIARARAEIAALQQRLLDSLRRTTAGKDKRQELDAARRMETRSQEAIQAEIDRVRLANQELRGQLSKTEADHRPLKDRLAELSRAIKTLENRPPDKKALRYHLPVSKPLGAGELLFECRGGRVAFIDLQPLLDEVRRQLPKRAEELGNRWETTDEVGPIGAFKLRYTVVRERSGPVDQAFTGLPPAESRGFGYQLDTWEVVPAWPVRGEPLADALADGSRFRDVVDASDPQIAALTFFVYPDSFELYRELRDYLFERGFVVAGRPLLMEAPIAGSRKGSISRGQ